MTTYIVLAIYFGVLFTVGALASKKISNMSDFFVGGKKLGYWVVAFSSRATGESGWLLLGLTGLGAMLGIKAMWAVVGEVIGVAICWLFMAKPFKKFTDTHNSMTIPDYLVSRFQSKTHVLRIVAAFVLTVFVTIYVSAQIDATGSAFETFLGWNYFVGVLVGFAIVLCYIFSGGFVAVAWSDFIQGIIMLVGLVILPFVGYFALPQFGRTDGLFNGLASIDPSLVSWWGEGGASLMNTMGIIGFLVIGIGFLGSPQIFVRFMSVKNEGEINKGTWVAILFTLFAGAAAVFSGMIGRLMFTKAGQSLVDILGNGGQEVLPMLVEAVMPTIVVAIYVVAVLSAIMSTVDSLLVVASSAVTRDIYQMVCFPSLKSENMVALSRKVTVILAVIALTISLTVAVLSPTRTIFWFVIFGWSGISASFCPMMLLSLFWKKYNEKGAIASMVSGFLGVPFFKFVAPKIAGIGPYMEQLSELAPSFVLALVVGVFVTLITRSKEVQPDADTLLKATRP